MLNVKLEVFEGPFDLLYKLIEKHKIDIYDIPIALITEKYVEEVEAMDEKDIDNIGEFLIMAATLLKIKSKMLLPPDEDEQEEAEDPRLELVARLIEYKKYKEASETLRKMEEESNEVFFKPQNTLLEEFKNTLDVDEFLSGVSIDSLTNAFLNIARQVKKDVVIDDEEIKDKIRDTVTRKRIYTVEQKMDLLVDRIKSSKNLKFEELFEEDSNRQEKVVTFLALLELMKLKAIKVMQEGTFGQITISNVEDGSDESNESFVEDGENNE